MRPRFYPALVNDRFGDPVVYVDLLTERRAMLFDLGDIGGLTARQLLRVSDVFVSHTHIDHFIGFDRLLRVLVGRAKHLRLYGPRAFIDHVEAKLAAYTWNLTDRFTDDLVFSVLELHGVGGGRRAGFRLKNGFAREDEATVRIDGGIILDEPSLAVRAVELAHRTPCLAFALAESEHVNVWKNRLADLGLEVGPWLGALKRAVFAKRPDDTPITVQRRGGAIDTMRLGFLRTAVLSITPGQKVAYVTDAACTPDNAGAIVDLARGADILFIESMFAAADAAIAADRAHLTTAEAGALARRAGVARLEPFHFSPRYAAEPDRLLSEAEAAFRSPTAGPNMTVAPP
ncbi:MAG: ribonuclease Z [Pseudomonadota bacterium]